MLRKPAVYLIARFGIGTGFEDNDTDRNAVSLRTRHKSQSRGKPRASDMGMSLKAVTILDKIRDVPS